jgi:tRNA dimethylallyltransferase
MNLIENSAASECDAVLGALAPEPELIAIVGPTASGKTELGMQLCDRVSGEILSVDSVQVYRDFNIGSGKPSAEEQARARHHLIDCVSANEPMDAAAFVRAADVAIAEIRSRGRTPILCGGTFLWMKALLQGLAEAPEGSPELRARHQAIVQEHGRERLHAMLAERDPKSAARLHPNDALRVGRALEVLELTGRTMSELQEAHGFKTTRHRAKIFARIHEKDVLSSRIEARAKAWLNTGWIEETEALIAKGYGETRPMTSVGYREVHSYLTGALPKEDLLTQVVQSTRIFARRQRTWLNHEPVTWV